MTFYVGQTVFLRYRDERPHKRNGVDLFEAKITKVGRKWADLDGTHGRFNMDTMRMDGGQYSSPGDVFYSRELYEETVLRNELWGRLKAITSPYTCPEHLSLEDVRWLVNKVTGRSK